MKKTLSLIAIFCSLSYVTFGQAEPSLLTKKRLDTKNAADQKTENKSIVTDLLAGRYYQALIKNGILKDKDGEIQLKSTVYGLIRIFDTTRREQNYFEKGRWSRNITVGTGATLGDHNSIKNVATSLTIAIINAREFKGKSGFFDMNRIDSAMSAFNLAADVVEKRIDTKLNAIDLTGLSTAEINKKTKELYDESGGKILDDFAKDNDFEKLKGLISDQQIKTSKDRWTKLSDEYDEIKKKLSGGPLLTYSHEGDFNGKKWTKLNNRLEFIKGFGGKEDTVRKYDFYVGVFYDKVQDTLQLLKTLNRGVFAVKGGINKVLFKDNKDGSSIFEAFGGLEYQNVHVGKYIGEKENEFKFDLKLSFRIAKNLYLPLDIKYNQTSGRFEGFVDLKFDVVNIFK